MKSIVFMVIVSFATAYVIADFGEGFCNLNQTYRHCGHCDRVCRPRTKSCSPDASEPGCYCQHGYLRQSENPNSPCVLPRDCMKCGKNQVYSSCGTACPKFCGRIEPMACILICVEGCFCKPPYILKSSNSTECVLEKDCP
ncbi:Trypsin Inhibitor like cysteine rich domain [Popillia japonica]|uniref:Trypsin Inhibitor like cysteine rich domain n=1 Tax=Popillia japonica TaxID=7064 RepID=A0AAW1HUU1_POPJA